MKYRDFQWVFMLFSTAIGAGVLFLPMQAGISGIVPFSLCLLIGLFAIFFAQKSLAKIVLESNGHENILEIFSLRFNKPLAVIAKTIYFLTCFTVIIAYATAIPTELAATFKTFKLTTLDLNNYWWFSIISLILPGILIMLNRELLLKVISVIVFPVVIGLTFLSLYLIPNWNINNLSLGTGSVHGFIINCLKILPIIIFATNFSQSVSQMTTYYKINSEVPRKHANRNIMIATIAIFLFTTLFAMSCLLSIDNNLIFQSRLENISIVTLLNQHLHLKYFGYATSIITCVALLGSFIGVFMGTAESLKEPVTFVIKKVLQQRIVARNENLMRTYSSLLIFISLILVAISQLHISSILGMLTAPAIAVLIFIMPLVFKVYTTKNFGFKANLTEYILLIIGIIVIFGFKAEAIFGYIFSIHV